MPQLKHKVPSYRLHKASGQAVVTLNGKDHYLGTYGSPDSHQRYEVLLSEWLGTGRQAISDSNGRSSAAPGVSINELFLAYWDYAQSYYVKGYNGNLCMAA